MKKAILLVMLTSISGFSQARAPKGADREVIAAVIVAESGGHGVKGMEAVWEVIHARASQRGTTCIEEALKSRLVKGKKVHQFECLNNTTPTVLWYRMKDHAHYWMVHDSILKWVPTSSHTGTNPYNRATHYHANSDSPNWAKGKKPIASFGGHKWYRGIK